jgi:hypothetical protein
MPDCAVRASSTCVLENVGGLLATNLSVETGSRKMAELLVPQMLAFEAELSYLPG